MVGKGDSFGLFGYDYRQLKIRKNKPDGPFGADFKPLFVRAALNQELVYVVHPLVANISHTPPTKISS